MKFNKTDLPGVVLIEPEPIADGRGFFARTFCQSEFGAYGLNTNVAQCNISFNKTRGTLRGMHYQRSPNTEAKLVRCTAGAVYDVVIDLRENSATFKQWAAFELTSTNRIALFIPEGFAHGFQTLEDNTEVFYQMYNFFAPQSAVGVRWNDPAFDIAWPLPVEVVSDKDRSYPDFNGAVL